MQQLNLCIFFQYKKSQPANTMITMLIMTLQTKILLLGGYENGKEQDFECVKLNI